MNFKSARNQRLHVELALVQLCQALDKKKRSNATVTGQSLVSAPTTKQTEQPAKSSISTGLDKRPKQTIPSTVISSNSVREPGDNNYYSSTPSIKNLLNKNTTSSPREAGQANITKDEPKDIRSENFEENHFLLAYNRFVESIKIEKPRLFSALNSHGPILSGNLNVELVFSNQAQQDDFVKNLKQEMTEFLRNELRNDNISIEMVISETEQKNLLYTEEDKFRHMVTKNPALGKLKQQMNLDFE
jgi:DNA polymerase-3 subunit gamma/tau